MDLVHGGGVHRSILVCRAHRMLRGNRTRGRVKVGIIHLATGVLEEDAEGEAMLAKYETSREIRG